MSVSVRPLVEADWPDVRRIYAEGIATGHATFEVAPPTTWVDFATGKLDGHRLVAVVDGRVVGWAAVSAVSTRQVYRGVVEHSVYVEAGGRGRGGSGMLCPENKASLALHARHGFRTIGTRERVGRDVAGRWRDTVLIERRSHRI